MKAEKTEKTVMTIKNMFWSWNDWSSKLNMMSIKIDENEDSMGRMLLNKWLISSSTFFFSFCSFELLLFSSETLFAVLFVEFFSKKLLHFRLFKKSSLFAIQCFNTFEMLIESSNDLNLSA